ncbi:pseudouridine 5'-phosphatase [Aureococcus anophagefferens]|nr:pseudouridine 5'-phosphatase [Aureococcus anophagefferens]
MAKPTCLLDIDGTLAVTDHLYLLAFQDLMASHGVSDVVDAAWFKAHVAGKVDDAVFADVLPGRRAPTSRAASAKKDALFCEHVSKTGAAIVEGLDGFLGRCRAEGVTCVAVSNAQRGGCEAAMARLGVEPKTCVVFEDSGTGIKAGVAAGVAVVGLTTSMTAEAMRSAGATATVADWTEVTPDFLRGLVAQQAAGPSCPLL